jgi:RNA polymerase sigma factor (sigma-70 family)
MSDGPTAEQLLADADWLKRLAVRLAGDADDADDLVQESWIAAWRRQPDPGRPLRPWLAKVARDLAGMKRRADGRRALRDEAWAERGVAASPEELLERVRLHRLLVDLVLELEEPQRSTILARFVEGRSAADLARALGVPESTVRGRLRDGLARLRTRLDERGGSRKAWAPGVLAFARGGMHVAKTGKLLVAFVALLALLLIGVGWQVTRRMSGSRLAVVPASSADSAAARAGFAAPGASAALAADAPLPDWASQPGVTLRPIAGVVTFQGQPVDGATVELGGATSDALGRAEASVRTGRDGRFRFVPRLAAPYRVVASAPGRASVLQDVDVRVPASRPPLEALVLELGDCSVALHGRVVDASGTGIAGAQVRYSAARTLRTDADGAYEVCVRVGAVNLRIEAAGYGTQQVLVQAAHARHRLDITLVPEGVVIGRVVFAATFAPIAHAQVSLWPHVSGPTQAAGAVGVTDADGRFQLVGVAPGRYGIGLRASDAFTARLGGETIVEAGATIDVGDVRIEATATVTGTLVDAEGAPVAGAQVRFRTDGAASLEGVSQADGRFAVRGVLPGAEKPFVDGYEVIAPAQVSIDLAHATDVRLVVRTLGSVSGLVTCRGRPAPGVAVQLLGGPADGQRPPRKMQSGADGRYEVRGLRPGAWKVYGVGDDVGAFSATPVAFEISAGEALTGVDLVLDAGASIAGTVVDEQGTPVAGAEVRFQLQRGDDRGDSLSADDGSFRVRLLSGGGAYAAEVRPYPGALSTMRPAASGFPIVTLDGGASEASGVRLVVARKARTISGVVVDDQARPIADVVVRAALMEGGGPPRFAPSVAYPSAVSDEQGTFAVTVWDEGSYALAARAGSGAPALQSGIPAGASGVRLTLSRPGSLSGTLRGFGADVLVVARDPRSANDQQQTAHVQGGRYVIADLAPGRYVVTAIERSATASAEAVVRGGETTALDLAARPTTALRGRVVIFPGGAPAPGLRCQVGPRVGDAMPPFGLLGESASSVADADGRFGFTDAPAGPVWIRCTSADSRLSDGIVAAEASAENATDVLVKVVRDADRGGARPGSVGFRFDPLATRPLVYAVRPGSAAARANVPVGGLVVAVDGVAVDGLSPGGVEVLISGRPQGEHARVTLLAAGGQATTYDLIVGPPWDWW